jgi:hypothetical protein
MSAARRLRRAMASAAKERGREQAGGKTLDALMTLARKVETASTAFADAAKTDVGELPADIGEMIMDRLYFLTETAILFTAIACLQDERRLLVLAGNGELEETRRAFQTVLDRARSNGVPVNIPVGEFSQLLQ